MPKPPTTSNWRKLALTLTLPALLLSACAPVHPPSPPLVVQPPAIPPLPATAKQPATPPQCLPTCSANLASVLDSWLNTPTAPAQPASSAKPATAP